MTSQPSPSTPSPVPPTAPQSPAGQEDPFTKIRALGIVRPDEGRWAAGVAAGLAHRWGVDPILVRGGFVALSLFFGVGLFVYGLGWLLLPHPDGRIHAQEVTHGTVTAGFVGSVLAILAGLPFGNGWSSHGPGWSFGPGIATLAVVAVVAWWLYRRRGGFTGSGTPGAGGTPTSTSSTTSSTTTSGATPAATSPGSGTAAYEPPGASTMSGSEPGAFTTPAAAVTVAPPPVRLERQRPANAPWRPLTLATLGLALLVGTATYYLADDNWAVTGAAALGVVGLGLVLSGLAGRRGGLLLPVAIVLALTALNTDAVPGHGATAGDSSWTPTTATEAIAGFSKGAGTTLIDLTSASVTAAATSVSPVTVPINQGVGTLTVIVPTGIAARVTVNSGAGTIDDQINTQQREGVGNQLAIRSGSGSPVLLVTVQLGAGEVVVRQAAPTASPSAASPSAASPSASTASSLPVTVPSASRSPR